MDRMVRLEKSRTGFAVATFGGVTALAWIALVLTGGAASLVNSFLRLNFIHIVVEIGPFEFSKAFSLLGIAIGMGYVGGFVFATVWNYYRRY